MLIFPTFFSKSVGVAADSWLSYMDRLLTLGRECVDEICLLKEKLLKLVDIYYDALDAPKKGLKVSYLQPVSFVQPDKFMVLVYGLNEAANGFNQFFAYEHLGIRLYLIIW